MGIDQNCPLFFYIVAEVEIPQGLIPLPKGDRLGIVVDLDRAPDDFGVGESDIVPSSTQYLTGQYWIYGSIGFEGYPTTRTIGIELGTVKHALRH